MNVVGLVCFWRADGPIGTVMKSAPVFFLDERPAFSVDFFTSLPYEWIAAVLVIGAGRMLPRYLCGY